MAYYTIGSSRARLLHRVKLVDEAGTEERVIWKVPKGEKSPDGIRYRLAYIPKGAGSPAVLFDNHHPKGHHKHIVGRQSPYAFVSVRQLLRDFQAEIEALK